MQEQETHSHEFLALSEGNQRRKKRQQQKSSSSKVLLENLKEVGSIVGKFITLIVIATALFPAIAWTQSPSISEKLDAMRDEIRDLTGIIAAMEEAAMPKCPETQSVEIDGLCVFHIGGYSFGHGAARAICAERGAELCTMEQMEFAHENRAQWCSWGWTKEIRRKDPKESGLIQVGKLAYPMQVVDSSCGGAAELIVQDNILNTTTAGANCCMVVPTE